jgi:L-amino acid N-acyltransferase YncA
MNYTLLSTGGDDAAGRGERVALGDGGHALVRPLREGDRPGVVSLFAGLSPESRARRFHSSGLHITPALIDLVTAGRAFVATREGRLVALASFHPLHDPTLAELAIVVADAEQRRGIGTALCRHLIRDARFAGIRRLIAEIEGSNPGMLALLRALDVPMTQARAWGIITVEVELSLASATSGKEAA